MQKKAQHFETRQTMRGNFFEIFHYLDISSRHLEAHYHDFYEIFVFLEGDVDFWVDGAVFRLKPGDILLINPGELHKPLALKEDGPYERIVLWINKAYLHSVSEGALAACFESDGSVGKKLLRPNSAKRGELLSALYKLIDEQYADGYAKNACAYGLLLQIMTYVNRLALETGGVPAEKDPSNTLIRDVLNYIGKHYQEDLSLETLAARFFVSKYYLSHEFSRTVGTGLHRYITLKRLYIAYDLLLQRVPAGEVCSLCGFRDYTSFFRAFKAEYGISPREVL